MLGLGIELVTPSFQTKHPNHCANQVISVMRYTISFVSPQIAYLQAYEMFFDTLKIMCTMYTIESMSINVSI